MAEYRWYVEPIGDFTNEVISLEANERPIGILIARRGMVCADGKPHNLWLCHRSFIAELKKSRHPLSFVEWVQEGNGKIRRWVRPKKGSGLPRPIRASALSER